MYVRCKVYHIANKRLNHFAVRCVFVNKSQYSYFSSCAMKPTIGLFVFIRVCLIRLALCLLPYFPPTYVLSISTSPDNKVGFVSRSIVLNLWLMN